MSRVWLIGNKGMLGTETAAALAGRGFDVTGTDKETDITSLPALEAFAVGRPPFRWVVNCAAYTAVDKAEDDEETCRALNALGPGNIAAAARGMGAGLVHISTDYVFDGRGIPGGEGGSLRPYTTEDEAHPIGVYGMTKREGEIAVLANNPAAYIIRSAWMYGAYGKNFVTTMLALMRERESLKVVNDQWGSPTWARDLARTIAALLAAGDAGKAIGHGIYHYTNEGLVTWFGFAREIYRIAREMGLLTKPCEVLPCTSAEYPAKVTRPAWSVLDKSKITKALGIVIPQWEESLKEFLKSCEV